VLLNLLIIFFIQEHSTVQDSMAALKDGQLQLLLTVSGDQYVKMDAQASVMPYNFFSNAITSCSRIIRAN
jgi:hypothetical protein